MATGVVDLLLQAKDRASAQVLKLEKNLTKLGKTAAKIDTSKFSAGFNKLKAGPSSGIGRFVTQTLQGFTAITAAGAKMALKIGMLPVKMLGGLMKFIPGVGGIVGGMVGVFAGGFQTIVGGAVSMAHGILDAAAGIIGSVVNIGVSIATGLVKAFAFAVDKIAGMFSTLAGKIGGALGKVGKVAAVAGVGLATLYGWQMKKGMWDIADIEMFEVALTTVTKSAARAKEVLAFADKASLKTAFTPKQMMQASAALETFGLKAERWLMRAADAASLFPISMDEIARALGRLKSGDTGEALERLRDIGINKLDLKAAGLEFSGAGQLISPIEQAMDAIEKIMIEKIGGGAEKAATKFWGVISTLQGYWQHFRRQIAKPMFDVFEKGLNRVKAAWEAFQKTAHYKALLSGFQRIGEVIATKVVTGVERLAGLVARIKWEQVGKTGKSAWDTIGKAIGSAKTKLGHVWEMIRSLDVSALGDHITDALATAGQGAISVFEQIADAATKSFARVGLALVGPIYDAISAFASKEGSLFGQLFGIQDFQSQAQALLDPISKIEGKLRTTAELGLGEKTHATFSKGRELLEGLRPKRTAPVFNEDSGRWEANKGLRPIFRGKQHEERVRAIDEKTGQWIWQKIGGEGGPTVGAGVDKITGKLGEIKDAILKKSNDEEEKQKAADAAWKKSLAETVKNARAAAAARAEKDKARTDKASGTSSLFISLLNKGWEKDKEAASKPSRAGDKPSHAGRRVGRGAGGAAGGYQLPQSKAQVKREAAVQKQLRRMEKGHFSAPGFGGKSTEAWSEARKRFGGAVQQQRQERALSKIEAIRQGRGEAARWSPKKRQREMDQWGESVFGKKGWQAKRQDMGLGGGPGQPGAAAGGPGAGAGGGPGGGKGGQGQQGPWAGTAQGAQQAAAAAQGAAQAAAQAAGEITAGFASITAQLQNMQEALNNINTGEA